jgi:DNA-binding transcriptional LysR family regulator
MNLRQIEVFRAVMLAGSVTDAARLLRVSQPAVSRLLRHTEDRLGMPLFKRTKGRLYPTEQAHVLLQEVEKVYKSVRLVQDVAQELAESRTGRLRIAASPSLGLAFVPKAIALFCKTRPKVKVSLEILPQADLIEQVVTHQADLGVSMFRVDHPSIEAHELGTGKLVCIAPKGHPLTELDIVSPGDLAGYPLISFDRTTPQGLMVDDAFIAAQVPREIAIEVRFGQTACALVQQGAGVALVDEFSVMHNSFPAIVARPFQCDARFSITLIHDRFRPLSVVGVAFLALLRELASALPAERPRKRHAHNTAL